MNLKKQAQDYDGFSLPTQELFPEPQPLPVTDEKPEPLPVEAPAAAELPVRSNEAEPMSVDDNYAEDMNYLAMGDDSVLFEVGEDEPAQMLTFTLPLVPGGEFQDDLEEPAELEVEEESNIEVSDDPWAWQVGTFLNWLCTKMNGVPTHSGKDSVGIERAIAYLEAIDREISKAVRSDINGEIDISQVEKARDELYQGLERLQDRLEKIQSNKNPRKKKKKKKADADHEMVKEAKATHVGGIMVTVPLLISTIARTCLNSMVSAGKDIEDVFDKLAKKYDLTPREELETMQLLADMGYPMRRPRGYDRDEEIDYTSTDNFDWSANYPG